MYIYTGIYISQSDNQYSNSNYNPDTTPNPFVYNINIYIYIHIHYTIPVYSANYTYIISTPYIYNNIYTPTPQLNPTNPHYLHIQCHSFTFNFT